MANSRVTARVVAGLLMALSLFVTSAAEAAQSQPFIDQNGDAPDTPVARSRPAPQAEIATVQPPRTGDANLLGRGAEKSLPLWAGLLWAGLSVSTLAFAAAGGVALARKARS